MVHQCALVSYQCDLASHTHHNLFGTEEELYAAISFLSRKGYDVVEASGHGHAAGEVTTPGGARFVVVDQFDQAFFAQTVD